MASAMCAEQPLVELPDGQNYDSCDEDDAPEGVLEDESLAAVADDKEPTREPGAASDFWRASCTRRGL